METLVWVQTGEPCRCPESVLDCECGAGHYEPRETQ